MGLLSWLWGRKPVSPSGDAGRRLRYGMIVAGTPGPIRSPAGLRDDTSDWNQEVIDSIPLARGRHQQAYHNNGLLRGAVRNRRARTIGAELRLRAAVPGNRIPGVDGTAAKAVNRTLTERYRLWAESGEADSTGLGRPMGIIQGQALIDADVRGGVLVHVVQRPQNRIVPIAVELIPIHRMRPPLGVAYDLRLVNQAGVQFTDERHSEIAGFWVELRDGYTERSGQFVFLPASQCRLYMCEQLVGVEAPLPRDVAVGRALHNIAQFAQETLESARTLAQAPMTITPPDGQSAEDFALGEGDEAITDESTGAVDIVANLGGIQARVLPPGAKAERHGATLPGPDAEAFNETQLRLAAAGADISYSRLSRKPDESYASGQQAERNDKPQVLIDRAAFGHIVGGFIWGKFCDACWAYDLVEMPGYLAHREYYTRNEWADPAEEAVNPVDAINALRSRRDAGNISDTAMAEANDEFYPDLIAQQVSDWQLRREAERAAGMPVNYLEGRTQTGLPFSGAPTEPDAPAPAEPAPPIEQQP